MDHKSVMIEKVDNGYVIRLNVDGPISSDSVTYVEKLWLQAACTVTEFFDEQLAISPVAPPIVSTWKGEPITGPPVYSTERDDTDRC